MRGIRGTAVIAGLAIIPVVPLASQGWVQLPDGHWTYEHFVGTGPATFQCGTPGFPPGVTCSTSGGSVTLTNGSSSATVRFEPFAQRLVTAGTQRTTIQIGQFRTEIQGGPFTLPQPFFSQAIIFRYQIPLTFGMPLSSSSTLFFEVNGVRTDVLATNGTNSRIPPVIPHPTGLRYGLVYWPFTIEPIRFEHNAIAALTVGIGIAPEPSTLVLLGTGGVLLGFVARMRSRRSHADSGQGA
jgi:hypothetical protein